MQKKRLTIGYLTPSIQDASQSQWYGILDAAEKYEVNLISFPGRSINQNKSYFNQFNIIYEMINKENVNGIISWASTIGNYIDIKELEAFHLNFQLIPMITIGRKFSGIPSVMMESYTGMYDAISHLIKIHGYRRLAFIRGPEHHLYAQERYQAYLDVLKNFDIPVNPDLITPPYIWDQYNGALAIKVLLDDRGLRPQIDFEAIIGANDHLILGAIDILHQRNLRVPYDIAVIGFDNIIEGRIMNPPLTSVLSPYYKTGYQALELLLSYMKGELIPEKVIMASHLMIGQTCGCVDKAVSQAVPEKSEMTAEKKTLEELLKTEEAPIISALINVMGDQWKQHSAAWAKQILNSFKLEILNHYPGHFHSTLNIILQNVKTIKTNPLANIGQFNSSWQGVISTLRRFILPYIINEHFLPAEEILQQARVMITFAAERDLMQQVLESNHLAANLHNISRELLIHFNIKELIAILADELPKLNITSCYLSLYENPKKYNYPDSIPEWSRLILAYNPEGKIKLKPQEQRFKTSRLIPEIIFTEKIQGFHAVEPLFFKDKQLGFIIMQVGPREGYIYEVIREQISNVLMGALLMEKEKLSTLKLIKMNKEINQLNRLLKDENQEIRTEMKLARYIQTALLPKEFENLHPDFEIAATLLPTNETGGDFYDISLDQKSNLWISIGDVAGYGVTPGLIMMMTLTVHTAISSNYQATASEILCKINRVLLKNVRGGLNDKHYVAFTTLKHQGNGFFQYAGAHQDMLIYRAKKKQCELIPTSGPWLNITPDIDPFTKDKTLSLDIGDILILFTDGLIEITNKRQKFIDIPDLIKLIIKHVDKKTNEMLDGMMKDVLSWCGGVYSDDMSLIIIKRIKSDVTITV